MGLKAEEIVGILSSRFGKDELLMGIKDLPKPSLLKDMDKSVDRIIRAIKNKERITVVGDYDVDGVSSTTIMKLFFDEIGHPITWVIPNRFKHGYGISPVIVEHLKKNKTTLAITVDNGISGIEAADAAADAGIDLIITDHHLLPPVPPKAFSIINPHQDDCTFPYKDICGAQIAWYLIAAIRSKLKIKSIDLMYYMQIASIAIIADMMPLKDINRVMVKAGLNDIANKKRPTVPGLAFFVDENECPQINSQDVGFGLAPRINSAGRLEDASHAANFLMSKDRLEAARGYRIIDEINKRRKKIEQQIADKADKQIQKDDEFIVVSGKDWHEGVLGIVASKIGQKYEKPTIVLTKNEETGLLKGSGRSYCDIDLFKTVGTTRDLLEKFGGHAAAVGLSLKEENLEKFKERLNEATKNRLFIKPEEENPIIGDIDFSEVTLELIDQIDQFGPYGQANPYPEFSAKNVKVEEYRTMGDGGQHFRVELSSGGVTITGVFFSFDEPMEKGGLYDITFALNKNRFKGKDYLQILLRKVEAVDTHKNLFSIMEKTSYSVEYQKIYSKEDTQKNPNKIYVFGDNLIHRGEAGQAVIRSCENAIGIPTKRTPSMEDKSFFSDKDSEKQAIEISINKILDLAKEGKTIVLPSDGLGTGLAMMEEKSPILFEYMIQELQSISPGYMLEFFNKIEHKNKL